MIIAVSIRAVAAAAALAAAAPAGAAPDGYEAFRKGLEASAVKVNDIHLPKCVYSLDEKAATAFLDRYFADHHYNQALRCNLGYAVFHWGSNQRALQAAHANVFTDRLAKFFRENDPAAANRRVLAEKGLLKHYFFMLVLLQQLPRAAKGLDAPRKVEIGHKIYDILKASRLCEPKHHRLPPARWPTLNLLKTQLLMTCFAYADAHDEHDRLTPLLNLAGPRGELWTTHRVLLLDNGHFSRAHVAALMMFLRAIPESRRVSCTMTCYDALHRKGRAPVSVHEFGSPATFNVFATAVASGASNQFPKGWTPVRCDSAMIVLAHEYNHIVDARHVAADETLRRQRKRLLAAAGDDHRNYLRSMFGDGFFRKNPQEFIASIANMYFCSSEASLACALAGARRGNYHPISQFLLMAAVYSDGQRCRFFRIDPRGRTTFTDCPVEIRDGLIRTLRHKGRTLEFTFADGLVTAVKLR